MNMLTHSSVWIFNQIRYNGLYKRIYELYMLGVAYFTCIGIRGPSVPAKWLIIIILNKSRELLGSREISKKIPDFRDCHLGPGLEALVGIPLGACISLNLFNFFVSTFTQSDHFLTNSYAGDFTVVRFGTGLWDLGSNVIVHFHTI